MKTFATKRLKNELQLEQDKTSALKINENENEDEETLMARVKKFVTGVFKTNKTNK
jgi:hypothetical protein